MTPSAYIIPGIEFPAEFPESVIKTVCKSFGISRDDIFKPSRKAEYCIPRQILYHILKLKFNLTYSQILEISNKSNHSTLVHSVKLVQNRIAYDKAFRNEYNLIINKLNNN